MPTVNGTILQCFHTYLAADGTLWEQVKSRVPSLLEAGFTALWLPPAYKIAHEGDPNRPKTYDLFNLGTGYYQPSQALKYGSGEQFCQTVEVARAAGMQVYADVAFNLEAAEVRGKLKEWSEWFLEISSVNGFRLDAAIEQPFGAINAWLDRLGSYAQQPLFNFGEYWLGEVGPLHWFLRETGERLALMDVPLHYNFHYASRHGDAFDLRGILDGTLMQQHPLGAVTFVENHHSQPLGLYESVVEAWFKPLAYALILLHREGYPCVFLADYDGADYAGVGRDGGTYDIAMIPHQFLLDRFLHARMNFAYGAQYDYFDHPNVVGWTRLGDPDHPKAMAVVMSNGAEGNKWMEVVRPEATFRDITGHITEPVETGADGWGEFFCNGGSVSVWVEQ
jgi:alpha-amylase